MQGTTEIKHTAMRKVSKEITMHSNNDPIY